MIYEVSTLEEYVNKIQAFGSRDGMLWYRGHGSVEYTLLPLLYRKRDVMFSDKRYDSIRYAEDMRIQNYMAKNYPFFKDYSMNRTEAIGMSQHFGAHTRFLDWSTSAFHSLIFALDQFFDDKAKKRTVFPCIWVLKPQLMNKRLIERAFSNANINAIEQQIKKYPNWSNDAIQQLKHFLSRMNEQSYRSIYTEGVASKDSHLDYIYNLSFFNDILESPNLSSWIGDDVLNPVFYFLAKAYIEGITFQNYYFESFPLAVWHPLNNERIKVQNAAFTVFPFPDSRAQNTNKLEHFAMEKNKELVGTLCKIVLVDPPKISDELKKMGAHKSWIYYEQDRVTSEIESGF